jgi:hypothetical protein
MGRDSTPAGLTPSESAKGLRCGSDWSRTARFAFTRPPFFWAVKADQVADDERLCLNGERRSDFAFCKSWVQVGQILQGSKHTASVERDNIHDVKQRADYTTADAACLRASGDFGNMQRTAMRVDRRLFRGP